MTTGARDGKTLKILAWQWRLLAHVVFHGRFGKLKPLLVAVEHAAKRTFAYENKELGEQLVYEKYRELRAEYPAEREQRTA